MSRKLEQGQIALFKYKEIKYTFIKAEPGQQKVLTSDPWSFLNSHLQLKLPNTRANNKIKIERAIYYAGLAEDFYKSAQNIPLPAKGALLYYGMLDLVKCFLSLNDIKLESSHEHHGLILPLGKKSTIEIKGKMKEAVNVFYEFSNLLGKPINGTHQINFKKALSHIPEIHSIYTSLGNLKRKLLPVNIEFQVNDEKTKIFTELIFEKQQEAKVDIQKFDRGDRDVYFKQGYPRTGKIVYRSARSKKFSPKNIHTIYCNILSDYKRFDIVPILTPQGYRYYVDLNPGDIAQLSYTLLSMFYLGSAARYRPLEVKSLLEGELRPLVSEFVSLSPRQFLYQMVSLITNKECVIPFAAI